MVNKIVEKIKKLLELATSPNENEAKAAMEQAQNLMAKYSVDETTLGDPSEIASKIIRKEYLNEELFYKQGVFERLPDILTIIPPIFGVYGLIWRKGTKSAYHPKEAKFELVGFETNVEMAIYALDSILNQGVIDARREYRKYRTTTFGVGFWQGFALGLAQKFQQYTDQSNGIVVYDKVREHLKTLTQSTYQAPRVDGVAINSGFESGLKAEIRRGLESQNTGKLIQ